MGKAMRDVDETSRSLFNYVDIEERISARHPLHKIRQVVNEPRRVCRRLIFVSYAAKVLLSRAS